VGALVQLSRERGVALTELGPEALEKLKSPITGADLQGLVAANAVEAKASPGGTGPATVADQLEDLKEASAGAKARAAATMRVSTLIDKLG
jgi:hypothetical protein